MSDKVLEFRDWILSLNTRRFGDIGEDMITSIFNLQDSGTLAYDKWDNVNENRVEIKVSRVWQKNKNRIRGNSIIDAFNNDSAKNRTLLSTDADVSNFDCNIQQIKPSEFDFLFYALFFLDCVEIYSMSKDQVFQCAGYSDKQHRGNVGEGQFHITEKNIDYHRQNFLQRVLSYSELYNLFNQ